MAYERLSDAKVKGDGLDVFIENTMKLFNLQLSIRNAEEENNFNRAIVDQNLSLDDQLDYRKEQLKRVGDDPGERKRLREEIKNLSARVEQQDFSEEYLGKVADVSAGITSIDSVVSWLKDQLDSASNPDVRIAIGKALDQKESEKFQLTQTLLNNQTDYAIKDKTASIINTQISRVNSERTKALLAGNDSQVSGYDLQLQALAKALNENSIDKDIKNFAVATVTGYASATQLLDSYNNKISSSAPSGPVKIGDITYASPQEFWKFKRDSYLADNSDSGFFSRYNNEVNTDFKVKNSNNSLTTDDVKRASLAYDSLTSRPELANYQFKVNSTKQDSLQTGVDFLSNNVLRSFNVNYDLNAATSALNGLKSIGANVEDAFSKVINAATALKSSQVNSIVQNAQQLLLENPSMSIGDAVNQSLKKGSAAVLSPSQLLTKSPEDIAKETITGAAGNQFGTEPRTTTPSANIPGAGTPPPTVPPLGSNQTGATPAATQPKPAISINKQLDFGVTDPQVRELQKFLNAQGFKVAESGAGAPGSETDYFGPLTQAALKKFQSSKGIVSTGDPLTTGFGRLGPQTISAISKLLGQ
ncbi:MAG: peptidoglycan-binding protein [Parcubacteria group bacterium]|nr:peptidoglycan-binding protein [Parcubacteria group bacterium]